MAKPAPAKPAAGGGGGRKKKEITALIKLQVKAAAANPAPPIGPALGQHGVNIMEFCRDFNEKTKDRAGDVVPVVITVYSDRSFEYIMKTSPVTQLLLKAAKAEKGAPDPKRQSVGTVTRAQVAAIAKAKIQDMNTENLDSAARLVAGSARSMGIQVVD